MPVIKTQNKVKELQPGDILNVLSTDPGVKHDIPAWCRINGHVVMDISQNEQEILIRIQVGENK